MRFPRGLSLVAGLVALCAGCASFRPQRAPAGVESAESVESEVRYEELADQYRKAKFLVELKACEEAVDPLERLLEADRDLRFPGTYRMLEECHTAAGRYDEAREVYRSGQELALAHPDPEVRALAEVMEDWAERYEIFLETDRRVVPEFSTYPTVVDGEEGLRRGLALEDSSGAPAFEGVVRVQARIDERGRVLYAFVQETSGVEAYDRAAVRAVRQARFTPAKMAGRNVRAWVSVPIVF